MCATPPWRPFPSARRLLAQSVGSVPGVRLVLVLARLRLLGLALLLCASALAAQSAFAAGPAPAGLSTSAQAAESLPKPWRAQPDPDPPPSSELWSMMTAVVLNGAVVSDNQLVHLSGSGQRPQVWLPSELAIRWRMNVQGRAQLDIESVQHVAFCGDTDRCQHDDSTALLSIDLSGDALLPLRVGPPAVEPVAVSDSAAWGAYINYDVSAWHIGKPGLAGQVEGRVYSAHGHGALRLDGVVFSSRFNRGYVAAYWQIDDPVARRSLQIGSTAVPDLAQTPGLPIVGLHVGSNARLQPMSPIQLRPAMLIPEGPRSLRADIFVNGLFQQAADVPYGAFHVEAQALHPGFGSMDVMTTEIDGSKRVTVVPFYQSPQMLEPGRQEWSLDLGFAESAGGRWHPRGLGLTAASLRRGMHRQATLRGQVLAAERASRATLGVDLVDPRLGQVSLSVVKQRTPLHQTSLTWLGLGYERVSRRGLLALRAEQAVQGNCARPAAADGDMGDAARMIGERLMRPCSTVSAAAGLEMGAGWSVSAMYARQTGVHGRYLGVVSAGLRWQLSAQVQLAMTAQRQMVPGARTGQLNLSLVWPIGSGWFGQSSAQRRHGHGTAAQSNLQWSASSVTPLEAGPRSRQQVFGTVGPQAEIGFRHADRTRHFDWQLEGRADSRRTTGRVGLHGAWGVAQGRPFMSRRIEDSFVMVDVGLPNLPVLLDNREVARTNGQGWAIVAEARAHQLNLIGVDTSALPIQYAMPRDQQQLVPGIHGGLVAVFDLSDGGIAVPLMDAAGQRLPAGTVVHISSQRLHTAVTSRGEVFLDRSDRAANLEALGPAGPCRARYEPQAGASALRCAAP